MRRWLLLASCWPLLLAQQRPTVLQFSGYDWELKTSRNRAGPGPNYFGPEGAWVDPVGRLHLRIAEEDGRWVCAEVINKANLGYGTYHFVVDDTSHLDPQVVLGLFTWDTEARQQHYRE